MTSRSLAPRDAVRVDGKRFMRAGQRFRIQGVTYGPFAPNLDGEQFPAPGRVREDFAQMRALGVNSIRTYHVPPEWLLDLADEEGMALYVDVPWPKHLCFLDSRQAQSDAREAVRRAAALGQGHPSLLAYSVGNEIPADIVRWHGARHVERFIADLADVARQADPGRPITYANYPSTEYLDLSFLDFATFNVYLHDPEVFRRYLVRLQNLVGERPLLLGEIGMDTMRHGEGEQAAFLGGHLGEAALMGLAGAFVFSWTDDWYTGGYQIEDWAFGLTRPDRSTKPACAAVASIYQRPLSALLPGAPRVSVVVCSYNGASTVEQCLRSLLALDYPDYEVILVDDGSTDNTAEIAARFPSVRYIRQANQGLSVARNVGLQSATGAIIAYTDSDCFADVDWLSHLVYQLQRSGASAVGGPNLTPDDGWLAACVGSAPGQPTHVLENDQVAEHIPGCNMAFRREALEAINGFLPRYRKAGDDVDLCWRLQQAGMWITFAPGAFVWHHRRQNPRTFLRQQAGYGEAEGLLWFDHPDRFNARGDGKWRGCMYGASPAAPRFGRPVIYRGTFGTGLFQTIYQPGDAHWAALPATLEWHAVTLLVALLATLWMPALALALGMLALSVAVAGLRAAQAPLAPGYRGLRSRALIAGLSYLQPLVRSWWRYRTRLSPPDILPAARMPEQPGTGRLPLSGKRAVAYWDEAWHERTELLDRIVSCLANDRRAAQVDSGWSRWDLRIYCHPWTLLQLATVQEDHGSGKRLLRLRYRVRPSAYLNTIGVLGLGAAAVAFRFDAITAGAVAIGAGIACAGLWWRGRKLASEVVGVVDAIAVKMGLLRCQKQPGVSAVRTVVRVRDPEEVNVA